MNPPPDKQLPASPEEWLHHAVSDLEYAKLGAEATDILSPQICFHAQQAVEKAIKAVLLFSDIDFPLTHDIVQLLDIIEVKGISVPKEFENADVLTPYAVEIRYPGYTTDIASQEVGEAIILAEKITTWAKEFISDTKS